MTSVCGAGIGAGVTRTAAVGESQGVSVGVGLGKGMRVAVGRGVAVERWLLCERGIVGVGVWVIAVQPVRENNASAIKKLWV